MIPRTFELSFLKANSWCMFVHGLKYIKLTYKKITKQN